MGFRVVEKSTITFKTDLTPLARIIHPSGILHAFRSSPTAPETANRMEHTFAWITNSLHIESALIHLEDLGFDRSHGMFFIPYSTKQNWLDRYPQASPMLECAGDGEVIAYQNYSPFAAVTGDLGRHPGGGDAEAREAVAAADDGDDGNGEDGADAKKRRQPSRTPNILRDSSCLPDAERDELHVEIYKYLSWLRDKLADMEESVAVTGEMGSDEAEPQVAAPVHVKAEDTGGKKRKREAAGSLKGVDLPGLGRVLDRMEDAFLIIPNAKLEEERERREQRQQSENDDGGEEGGEARALVGRPFLEEGLRPTLSQMVAARDLAGKGRRSRRKKPKRSGNPTRSHDRKPKDFEDMFRRLEKYKDEHGNCVVPKSYKGDGELARWVKSIREKKAINLRKGIEVEEISPGEHPSAKALTEERVGRLNSLGFIWNMSSGPRMSWEGRFNELLEYYEENGKWPSQSMGVLGEWIHKQRTKYAMKDDKFMREKAPKLDAVGFEWTPRGYTRMNWEEGFEMLMEFGRINGHFNVPQPPASEANIDDANRNKKSASHRLYRWVESLHGMYRSYKLGRQSGSLTEERVVLLIKHGFTFRHDLMEAPMTTTFEHV